MAPPLEDAISPGGRSHLHPEPQGRVGTPPGAHVRMSEGRLMGWLPFFSWLPGTKYIFFLIGPAADGYLASRESERDFVSNAEK